MQRAADMESTVARIGDRRRDSRRGRALPRRARARRRAPGRAALARTGVCWPEFARPRLGRRGIERSKRARPTGDDRLGITGVFCAIAETGTLVVVSGADTPTATTLLPDTHVAVVSASSHCRQHGRRVCADPPRARHPMPRAINLDLGTVAHRRHRADHRARRARAVPRPHPGRRSRRASACRPTPAAKTVETTKRGPNVSTSRQSQALAGRVRRAWASAKLNRRWEHDMSMRKKILVAALALGAIGGLAASEAKTVVEIEVAPPPPRVEVVRRTAARLRLGAGLLALERPQTRMGRRRLGTRAPRLSLRAAALGAGSRRTLALRSKAAGVR